MDGKDWGARGEIGGWARMWSKRFGKVGGCHSGMG